MLFIDISVAFYPIPPQMDTASVWNTQHDWTILLWDNVCVPLIVFEDLSLILMQAKRDLYHTSWFPQEVIMLFIDISVAFYPIPPQMDTASVWNTQHDWTILLWDNVCVPLRAIITETLTVDLLW